MERRAIGDGKAKRMDSNATKTLKASTEAKLALRSASPCSPEPERRPAKKAVVKITKAASKRGRAATAPPETKKAKARSDSSPRRSLSRRPSRESSYESFASEQSESPAPKSKVPKAAKSKAKVSAAAEKAARPRPKAPAAAKERAKVPAPPSRPVITAADEGSFQAAVLEKLRSLCGEHEDAKVLAEYIVVMVAGSKGKEEMALELKPFFQDQAQAESFVEWVEECKFKFLTGQKLLSPASTGTADGHRSNAAAADSFWGPAPVKASTASSAQASAAAAPPAKGRAETPAAPSGKPRPGPNVAVTGRVVLQPNPDYEAPATSRTAGAPAVATTSPSSAASPTNGSSGASKVQLLENMTKQLQLILTKLNDKSLNDAMREKYQGLAQNIQVQMAKITKPTQVRGGRRL